MSEMFHKMYNCKSFFSGYTIFAFTLCQSPTCIPTTLSVPSMCWDKIASIDALLASVSQMNWWLKSRRLSIGALFSLSFKESNAD